MLLQVALHVSMDHLTQWCDAHACPELAVAARTNAKRYTSLLADAIDDMVHKHWADNNKEPPVKVDALFPFTVSMYIHCRMHWTHSSTNV